MTSVSGVGHEPAAIVLTIPGSHSRSRSHTRACRVNPGEKQGRPEEKTIHDFGLLGLGCSQCGAVQTLPPIPYHLACQLQCASEALTIKRIQLSCVRPTL